MDNYLVRLYLTYKYCKPFDHCFFVKNVNENNFLLFNRTQNICKTHKIYDDYIYISYMLLSKM